MMLALVRDSFRQWKADDASQMAAAIAYYAAFSLVPFVLLILMIAGAVLNQNVAQEYFFAQMQTYIGQEGADAIRSLVESAQSSSRTGLAAVFGILLLLLGASGLMKELQEAMNTVWRIHANPTAGGLKILVLRRVFSMAMVVTIGFLFILSLLATTAVSFILGIFTDIAPFLQTFLPLSNILLSFALVAVLFALLYKFLPDVHVPFSCVWPGALIATSFFTVGQVALGFYLGQRNFTEVYGVAGSIILILLWVNYSSQILYFGAAFVRQYALSRGVNVKPKSYAIFVPEKKKLVVRRARLAPLRKAGVVMKTLFTESKIAWKIWRWKNRK